MLKVSGEAMAGENGFGIDPEVVQAIAREVAEASLGGIQVAVVVGGGTSSAARRTRGRGSTARRRTTWGECYMRARGARFTCTEPLPQYRVPTAVRVFVPCADREPDAKRQPPLPLLAGCSRRS